jgi:hypothetical protein
MFIESRDISVRGGAPHHRTPPRAPLQRNAWIVRVTPVVGISRSCNAESLQETASFPLAKVVVVGSNPFSRSENSAGHGVRSTTRDEIRTPDSDPGGAELDDIVDLGTSRGETTS